LGGDPLADAIRTEVATEIRCRPSLSGRSSDSRLNPLSRFGVSEMIKHQCHATNSPDRVREVLARNVWSGPVNRLKERILARMDVGGRS
jgi:hypothetical protein